MTWTLRRAQAPRSQRRERKQVSCVVSHEISRFGCVVRLARIGEQARGVVQESGDFLARWRFRLEQPALDESLQVFAG